MRCFIVNRGITNVAALNKYGSPESDDAISVARPLEEGDESVPWNVQRTHCHHSKPSLGIGQAPGCSIRMSLCAKEIPANDKVWWHDWIYISRSIRGALRPTD